MTRRGARACFSAALGSLGWPLLAGLGLCGIFYGLILEGPWQSLLLHRYFAGHWVTYVETALFCIGLVALLARMSDLCWQLAGLNRSLLPETSAEVTDGERLLAALSQLPARVQRTYLVRRLSTALDYVRRRGSAEGLGDELKYLADVDAERMQDSYGLVRIVIWAIPMLGFLGTVIGITQALGTLNWEEFATSPKTAGEELGAGLYVAFDTTALALSLSMVLMAVQFLVERFDNQLHEAVTQRVEEELTDRFAPAETVKDPQMAAVQRMCQAVMKTSEQLVQRQVQLWQSAIDAAHQHWQQIVHTSAEQIEATLSSALDHSLQKHDQRLARVEQEAAEQARERAQQWQTLLSDNARIMHNQQLELARQGEVMLQVVQATGDVVKLEQALNGNLQALAGAKNFEDTVMSLSAAIHLLNTRLAPVSAEQREVGLRKGEVQGKAA